MPSAEIFPRAHRIRDHLYCCKPPLPNLDDAIRAVVERVAEEVAERVVFQALDERGLMND